MADPPGNGRIIPDSDPDWDPNSPSPDVSATAGPSTRVIPDSDPGWDPNSPSPDISATTHASARVIPDSDPGWDPNSPSPVISVAHPHTLGTDVVGTDPSPNPMLELPFQNLPTSELTELLSWSPTPEPAGPRTRFSINETLAAISAEFPDVQNGSWPAGWPFAVQKSWQPSPDSSGVFAAGKRIPLHADDEGCILRVSSKGWALVFCHPTSERDSKNLSNIGFVPLDCLKYPDEDARKYGDTQIVDNIRVAVDVAAQLSSDSVGLLESTLHGLLSAFHAEEDLSEDWEAVDNAFGVDGAVRTILAGTIPEVAALLNDPNFTVEDLIAAKQDFDPSRGSVVYLRIYRFADGTYLLYVGQTIDPKQREDDHDRMVANPGKSEHYLTVHDCEEAWMMPLSYIGDDHLLTVAEQTWLLLFQSYNRKVLAGVDYLDPNNTYSSAASDVIRAIHLTKIADTTFEVTQWPGVSRRPSFAPLHPSLGTNWQSPLGNTWIRKPWTMVETYTEWGMLKCFMRAGVVTIEQTDQKDCMALYIKAAYTGVRDRNGEGHTLANISFWLGSTASGPKPEVGQVIYPVFEIIEPGKIHPFAYACMPTVAAWSNRDDVMRLAFRIEWQDSDGKWWSRYQQGAAFRKRMKGTGASPEYAAPPWARATAMLAYLQQERFGADTPAWFVSTNRARIVKVSFDNFTQTYSIDDNPIPSGTALQTISFPTPTSIAANTQQLVQLGCQNASAVPGSITLAVRKRTACDTCYVHNKNHQRKPCIDYEGHGRCERCHILRHDCTFTPSAVIEASDEMQKALYWIQGTDSFQDFDDSAFETGAA